MENKEYKINAAEVNEEELENVSGGGSVAMNLAVCEICEKGLLPREQVKEDGMTFCRLCHQKWLNKKVSI